MLFRSLECELRGPDGVARHVEVELWSGRSIASVTAHLAGLLRVPPDRQWRLIALPAGEVLDPNRAAADLLVSGIELAVSESFVA